MHSSESSNNDSMQAELASPYLKKDRYRPQRLRNRLYLVSLLGIVAFLMTALISVITPFEGADSPQCRPIYMYPSYAKIDGFDTRYTKLAQKYHLYLYREQGKDKEPLSNGEIQLDGIPILFIPGNAGSFKQARSIAAASANLYFESANDINNPLTSNLDFFTADFNEDFTAFHGRTMLDQAEYLNDAVSYILSLYKQNKSDKKYPAPTSVIIIGHSMGGIVARVMMTLKNYLPESVNSVITLSTPHAAAPVTFDGDILKTYVQVNNYWRSKFADDSSFFSKNVSLISITGGILDTVLPADYTIIEDIIPYTNGFTTYTTTIPGVWTPVDHLAVVWCDQLRRVIAKLLLEMVDVTSPAKTHPLEKRMTLSRKLLLSGLEDYAVQDYNVFGPKNEAIRTLDSFEDTIEIKPNAKLVVKSDTIQSYSAYSIFNIPDKSEELQFSVLTSLDKLPIYFCQKSLMKMNFSHGSNEQKLKCVSATDDLITIPKSVEGINTIIPSSLDGEKKYFKVLNLNATVLAKYDFISLETPKKSEIQGNFLIAELTTLESVKAVNKNMFSMLTNGVRLSHEELGASSSISTIRFPNLWSSLISYKMRVNYSSKDLIFQPLIRQWVERPFETKWHLAASGDSFRVNFHNVAPFIPLEETHDKSLKMTLISPPYVELKATLSVDWCMTLKMLFLRYRLAMASFPIALIALVLASQFFYYNESGEFISFEVGMSRILKNHGFKLLATVSLLTPLTNISIIQRLLFLLDPVGLNNPLLLEEQHITTNFFFLGIRELFMWWLGPFFLLITIGLVFLVYKFIVVVEFIALAIATFLEGLLSRCATEKYHSSIFTIEKELDRAFKLRHAIGVLLLMISVVLYIPYQFAFILTALVQITVCIKLAIIDNKMDKNYTNLRNYNTSLLMLFLFIIPINIPIIVVFLHNFAIKWKTPFRSHHNFLAILPVILLVESNSTFRIPATVSNKGFNGIITFGSLVYLSFYSLVYGIRNLYWLYHLFNLISMWLFCGTLDTF